MYKYLGRKSILIIVVLLLAIFSIYPFSSWDAGFRFLRQFPPTISRGLDLKGGMYLLLEVDTSKFKDAAETSRVVNTTIKIIRNRIDARGLKEISVKKQPPNRIEIEIPDVKNARNIKDLIFKTGRLEFRMVHEDNDELIDKFVDSEGDILPGIILPAGYEILYEFPRDQEGNYQYKEDGVTKLRRPHLIAKKIELTGNDLRTATVEFSRETNRPEIAFILKTEPAAKFADLTEQYSPKADGKQYRLAIVLDDVVQMAPFIKGRIPDGSGRIEGGFSLEEAKDVSNILRSGSYESDLIPVEEQTIGPSLGADAIRQGFFAAQIGFLAVVVFMLIQYLMAGVIADIVLVFNLLFILGTLAGFGATLTLPGIAGIILTIGMAVDANVIVFERIKEELKAGKTIRSAIESGYKKAFSTIADANITTIIVAVVLYQFGATSIKGFSVTLIIGIITSMFTSLFVTKVIMALLTLNKKVNNLPIFSLFSTIIGSNKPRG